MLPHNPPSTDVPLHSHIKAFAERYLATLDEDSPCDNLYAIFLAELERPLIEATLKHTRGNQSRTAQLLGLNRGTLRSKMKQHGLL